MHVRNPGLSCLLVLVVAAAACGGDTGESGASSGASASTSLTDLDVCALLTADEIRSATGLSPAAGTDPMESSNSVPLCMWPSAENNLRQVAQVLVTYAPAPTFEEYRASAAAEQLQVTRIEGPGRYTVQVEDLQMIQTIGETRMVQVMVETAPGIDPTAAAVSLAGTVLERVE